MMEGGLVMSKNVASYHSTVEIDRPPFVIRPRRRVAPLLVELHLVAFAVPPNLLRLQLH